MTNPKQPAPKSSLVDNKAAKTKPGFWFFFAIFMSIFGGVIAPQLKAAEVETVPSFQVEVIGEGKPVLLIPGLMSDSRVWQHTAAALKQDYQLHLISVAGFAGAPAIAGELLPRLKQDLLQYIATQQLQQPAIVGHSLGAFLAFSLASSAPEQIGTVVAVDGLPYIAPIFSRNPATQVADMQQQALQIKAYYQQLNGEQLKAGAAQGIFIQARAPEHQQLVLEMAAASDANSVGQAMYELLTTDLRPEVAVITSKVWLLGASGALPAAQQQQAAALYQQQIAGIANATLLMNTDSRHFMMLDEPEWFVSTLRQALQE
ncbi:alpha/beta hydrolase [Alishewanella agri BL06]|uniref:Alpha/beta hydrolase n=1 Tax=Alishewanella agri BL06 TaxID=1195246 RepID=I9DPD9_9ALTE|nr:alpha/beta hydrolase [Alishewanella agri]EIW87865.1 alpha/beta hydrolase [Alishewanella agri BL06]